MPKKIGMLEIPKSKVEANREMFDSYIEIDDGNNHN